MRKIFGILLALIALLFTTITTASAQSLEQTFLLEPTQDLIDGAVKKVKITFPDASGEIKVCLENDFCLKDIRVSSTGLGDLTKVFNYLNKGLEDKSFDINKFKSLDAANSITVCGAGTSALKTDCDPESDVWFHAGNYYIATLFEKKGDKWFPSSRGGFYVNHHHPKVEIIKKKNGPPEIFDVQVTYNKLVKDGKWKNNNFQLVIVGPGIKEEVCVPKGKKNPSEGETLSVTFPTNKWFNDDDNKIGGKKPLGLASGTYTIKVNDQNGEGGRTGDFDGDDCGGGFTFVNFVCSVDPKKETRCKEIKDPDQSDATKFFALLESLTKTLGSGVPLPCRDGQPNVKNPLECEKIDTAIGTIELNPVGFITRLFSLVLTFAGVGALFLIIYSGYRILISRGNPEIIKGARETLTAAIVGLLFIIFSLVILSVIANDILKIPGFG